MPGSSAPQSSSQTSQPKTSQSAYQGDHPGNHPGSNHASNRKAQESNQANQNTSQSEAQHALSDRELQIVELIAAGLTNQEISERLAISKRTVDNHVSNVLSKTATGNRVALVRWALQSGKVCIDELNCCTLPENPG